MGLSAMGVGGSGAVRGPKGVTGSLGGTSGGNPVVSNGAAGI